MKLYGVFSGWMMAALIAMPSVVGAQTPVNGYGRVAAIAGSTLTVTNVSETYDTFEDGEFVIVMQMQDDVIGGNTGNSATFGDVSAIQSAGLYEVAIIASHTEVSFLPNTITLASALSNTYHTGVNACVQIISYPTLGSPNYTSPASGISASLWDGNTGGVTAFRVNGILTIGGSINADGAGFRGGSKNVTNGYTGCDGTTYRTTVGTRYAGKGEGIYLNTNAGYAAGRGKMLNGGGGGNDVNAGGAGGGNYSAGGDGGIGWTPAGTGCSPGVGGLGGTFLSAYISGSRLFMGGGGGGGHENDGVGTAGSNGGGLVLIRANSIATSGICANRTISA
ncbi:MAG TPA: T9SS C-terminal target domain-containing protein, partial [Bacteroidia bacterium]|nr:T9SS C-terminal target domain-containing protein [Bacteroidia bacterium]